MDKYLKRRKIVVNEISSIVIRLKDVKKDSALELDNNNGRKMLVNEIYNKKECLITNGLEKKYETIAVWKPIDKKQMKTPVFVTGNGGIETATFTQMARQDRHKHMIATEIYIVLKGTMYIKVNDEPIKLSAGDELIILPGTYHEVIMQGEYLTRVHLLNCHGKEDKYI